MDGFIIVDGKGLSKITDKLGDVDRKDLSSVVRLKNIIKIPSSVLMLRDNSITDLKIYDIYKIISFFRGTSSKSSYVYDLTPDNIKAPESFDKIWRKNLKVTDVDRERIKVFIANASHDPRIPGLANWGARVVENLGGSVLETQNAFAEFDENTLITESSDLKTFLALKDVLDIKKTLQVNDLNKDDDNNPQIFRTKISLVLVNN
jgi:hypothetical protein